jgi:hypothetical protein
MEIPMSKILIGLGAFFVLAGVVVMVAPEQITDAADWGSPRTQVWAGIGRIIIGLLLITAASASRYPRGIKILGALGLIGGTVIFLLPRDTWQGLVDYWLVQNLGAYRFGGGAVAVLLGAFLIHAARPRALEA